MVVTQWVNKKIAGLNPCVGVLPSKRDQCFYSSTEELFIAKNLVGLLFIIVLDQCIIYGIVLNGFGESFVGGVSFFSKVV